MRNGGIELELKNHEDKRGINTMTVRALPRSDLRADKRECWFVMVLSVAVGRSGQVRTWKQNQVFKLLVTLQNCRRRCQSRWRKKYLYTVVHMLTLDPPVECQITDLMRYEQVH